MESVRKSVRVLAKSVAVLNPVSATEAEEEKSRMSNRKHGTKS